MSLKGRRILIGITGSIAAYKIPLLIRLLKKSGAEVKVILTEAATDFVTPLTLSALAETPVSIDPFDKRTGAWNSHIELAYWADLFLIAPVSANTLAKMASGIADNLLLTTYLAARCPVFFAPAMDLDMYKHPTTQRNIEIIRTYGHRLIEPKEGELASGLCGAGRMEEPEAMHQIIEDYFAGNSILSSKRILITAGPTQENIDPVRYIGNHSSGKMGFAIAEAMADSGADVTLISGPVNLPTPHHRIIRIDVRSADEMHEECKLQAPEMDIIIMAAAVADYKPAKTLENKLKKDASSLQLKLEATPDILSQLVHNRKPGQLIIGFALETNDGIANAQKKLQNKQLDFIVLNLLKEKESGFGSDTNQIVIIEKSGSITEYPLKPKKQVAEDICKFIENLMSKGAVN